MWWFASLVKTTSTHWGCALDWLSKKFFGGVSVSHPDFGSASSEVSSAVALTPDQEREALLLDFCIDWMGQGQVDVVDVYQWLFARQVPDSVAWQQSFYDGLSLDEVKARLELLSAEDLRGLVVSLLIQRRISEKYTPLRGQWLDLSDEDLSGACVEFQRGALWAQAKLKKGLS